MQVLRRAVTSLVAIVLVLVLAPSARAAAPPDTTVTLEPTSVTSGGAAVVERVAGGGTDPDTWLMNATVHIHNGGFYAVNVQSVTVQIGSHTVTTDTGANDLIGTEGDIRLDHSLTGTFPLPPSATVLVTFLKYDPIVVTVPIREMQAAVPGGAFYLPYRAAGQPANTYWGNLESQTEASHHFSNPAQTYAYDLSLYRFDASKGHWTTIRSGYSATNLKGRLAYGQKVYAMASGTVIECRNSLPDNPIGTTDTKRGAGNTLTVRTDGGEYLSYDHLQPHSIPASLCPQDSVPTDGESAPVHALPRHVQLGQQIGLVGNSGHTSEPHTHIQLDRNPPYDVDDNGARSAPGLPLEFLRFQVSPDRATVSNTFPPLQTIGDNGAAALTAGGLFRPNAPCDLLSVPYGAPEASLLGHGFTCLNEHLSDLGRQGYRPTIVDGGRVGANTVFDVIAKPNRPATDTLINLTADQLNAANAAHDPGVGWRIADVDEFLVGANLRFSAVWAKIGGASRTLFTDLDEGTFASVGNFENQHGLRPVKVSPVGTAGGIRYSSIWEATDVSGPGDIIVENATVGAFPTLFTKRTKAGYRLQAIAAFNLKSQTGNAMIDAVWSRSGDPNYVAKNNLTTTQWQTQWGKELAAGFSTQSLSPFASGGAAHHASLWLGPF